MDLREMISKLKTDDVIYLGCQPTKNGKVRNMACGSGFFYIGYADGIDLERYGDREVVDAYSHETDYPGITILISGVEHGKYWMWHEYDPSVKPSDRFFCPNPGVFEELYFAIYSQCIKDYRKIIRENMKGQPTDIAEVEDILVFSRRKASAEKIIDFLEGNASGQNLLREVDDEIRVMFLHPEINKIGESEKKFAALRKAKAELRAERVRKSERKLYAKIKGRSVNHDMD